MPAGQGGAAAGSSYYPIQFANVSGASCTLYGYPGVSFVTARGGRQIGPAATRNPAVARQLVTLSPGQTVHAELQVVNAENYPPAGCGLVTAHWLKIYPPNQTAPAYVSFTAQACSKPKQILSVRDRPAGHGRAVAEPVAFPVMDDLFPRLRARLRPRCRRDARVQRAARVRRHDPGPVRRRGPGGPGPDGRGRRPAGPPLDDPHDEAHLATSERAARAWLGDLELHRRNPLRAPGRP